MKSSAAILLAIILSGCATSAIVYLQSAVGDMVRCGPYPDSTVAARMQLENCVSDHQPKGYQPVPSPLRMIPAF